MSPRVDLDRECLRIELRAIIQGIHDARLYAARIEKETGKNPIPAETRALMARTLMELAKID